MVAKAPRKTPNKPAAKTAQLVTIPAEKVAQAAASGGSLPQVEVVMVSSRPASIRRCGHRFTHEPYGLLLSDLTAHQLELLESDPDLVTERATIDAPTAAELGHTPSTDTGA